MCPGVATYRNYYEIDGQRFSHQIDPRTLRPITHPTASVTVIHESTMWADALATALIILGPVDGLALAEERNLAALFLVYTEDGGVDEIVSSTMRPYVTTSPNPRGT